MNGIIIVNKEKGFTSHDVVAKLRGILHMKKIGHTGTLDPDATGVLPVCVGRATKVCDLLTDRDKAYVAKVKLGVTTDTQDLTGEVLSRRSVSVTEEQLRETAAAFTGDILQIPPMYSAVKVNGKRLYELARKGQQVERKPRPVTIHSLKITDFSPEKGAFTMEAACSKGTYIRTLCHDMGERLGCGAAMKSLVRTRVGNFSLEQAKTLSEIGEIVGRSGAEEILIPVDRLFEERRLARVEEEALKLLKNGNVIPRSLLSCDILPADGEQVRVYGPDGDFYALYRYVKKENAFHVVKMFHE